MENLEFDSETALNSASIPKCFPSNLTPQVLRELNRFRMTGALCDAVLATEDGAAFRVHKIAMSWCSSYFRILFTTPLIDKSSGKRPCFEKYFTIPGLSSSTLETIIKFAYSGIVDINGDNVNELLPAADQFNVVGIVDRCEMYLLENMTPENCVGVWRFGKDYFMTRLETESFRFLLRYFPQISVNSEEFLHLGVKLIEDILKSNSLNVPSEFLVWTAIKRWCQFTLTDRKKFVPQLVHCVRLALLPIDEFRQLMDDPWIFSDAHCRTHLKIVSQFILNELQDPSEALNDEKTVLMFTPRHPNDVIVVGGGWTLSGPTSLFEIYDCRADSWKMMFFKDFSVKYFYQTVSLEDSVYVIGGYTGQEYLNSCWRIDTKSLTVQEISPMQEMRCYHCATSLDDKIYAIGGFNGFDRLKTVECFDIHNNQWTYVSPMLEKRSDASAASLRNRVFVVGGYDGEEVHLSVECYYVDIDSWLFLRPMLRCRTGAGCVALNDALYAIGGYNGYHRLKSVEKYCMNSRRWVAMKAMRQARSNFAVSLLENKIYVMGGQRDSGVNVTELAECFDLSRMKWFPIAPMNVSRSGTSACTVSGIQDITPYIKDDRFRCLLKTDVSRETIDVCS